MNVYAAREIEQLMADLEGGRNRAVMAAFAGKGRSRRPVVVLTPDAVLANPAGLAYVTPEHHSVLWEAVCAGTSETTPRTIEVDLSIGAVQAVVHQIGDCAGAAFCVEIQREVAGDSARPGHEPGPKLHPLPEVDARLLGAVRVAAAIAIDGHQGTGKHHVSRAIAALDPQRAVHVVDLADCRTADRSVWLPAALAALSEGSCLILRHLEDGDSSENTVKALTALLRLSAAAETRSAGGCLLLNVHLDKAERQVADLVRQSAVTVRLPDLCQMRMHIPELARTMLAELDGIRPHTTLSSAARQALMAWRWPGNLTELRQAMLEVAATRPGWVVQLPDLPLWLRDAAQGRQLAGLERAERDAIIAALQEARWNRSAAAGLLGIGRTTLYRRMRALGIDCPEAMPH